MTVCMWSRHLTIFELGITAGYWIFSNHFGHSSKISICPTNSQTPVQQNYLTNI